MARLVQYAPGAMELTLILVSAKVEAIIRVRWIAAALEEA